MEGTRTHEAEAAAPAPSVTLDAYKSFLDHFSIDMYSFFEWGLSSTVFPPIVAVETEWRELKERVLSDRVVFIRRYGRGERSTGLYQELYRELFHNSHVTACRTNNSEPHRLIQRLTGLHRNVEIFNFQVSHIWGRTKNPLLFCAPWNICYTPKIIDPFTGHEAKGIWPAEYQRLFLLKAVTLYRPFITEYNELLEQYAVSERTAAFIDSLQGRIPQKELKQFSKDARRELEPIEL